MGLVAISAKQNINEQMTEKEVTNSSIADLLVSGSKKLYLRDIYSLMTAA